MVNGLDPKTRYDYEATVTVTGQTSQSATGSFTTLDAATLPPAPSVTVTPTTNSATFVFVAVTGATSYDLRVMNKQGGGSIVGSASTADPSKAVVISGLDPKTRYDYEATATVSGQTSQAATGSFTTLDATTRPPRPSVAHAVGPNSVTFTFAVVDGATSYDVTVLDNLGGSVVGRGSTADPKKPVTLNGLHNKTQYYFEATVTVAGQTSDTETGSFVTDDVASAVERFDSGIPDRYGLGQNYPNPFNPTTTIQFSLPSSSNVRISIYNSLGNLVCLLVNGHYAPGRYSTTWDASALPSGVYFYRLQTDTYTSTKRLLLLK
jgi:hypothetical protein